MKKSTMKVLSFVMALVMIVGTLAVVPFSADGVVAEAKHVHTKGEVVKTEAPTCTLFGYTVYKCAACGESFVDDVTDKVEHDYQNVGEIPADCATGTAGCTAGVRCTLCGDVAEGCYEIPAVHGEAYRIIDGSYKFDEEGNIVTTPDCLEGVTYQKYCPTCGLVIEDKVDTIVAPEDLHDCTVELGDDAPTCTEDGYLTIVCTNEGAYYFGDCINDSYFDDCAYVGPVKVKVAKLGHNWVEIEDKYGEPYKHYKQCTRCGEIEEIKDDNPGGGQVDPGNPGENPTTPECHQWVSNGFRFSVSGEVSMSSMEYDGTAEEFILAYAKYSYKADLTELFDCKLCNNQRLVTRIKRTGLEPDNGHFYGSYTFSFKGDVLTKDGLKYVDISQTYAGSVVVEYACGKPVKTTETCGLCGDVKVTEAKSAQTHFYKQYWVCQNPACEKADEELVTITLVDGREIKATLPEGYYHCSNCEHPHVTKVCVSPEGYTKGAYTAYTMTYIGDHRTPEATPQDARINDETDRLFEKNSGIENVEEEIKITLCIDTDGKEFVTSEHVLDAKHYTPGDCLNKEKTWKTCKICGSEYDVVYGELGDHDWTEWETTPATCKDLEYKTRKCKICGKTESELTGTEYGPHKFGEWKYVEGEEPSCLQEGLARRYCTVCLEAYEEAVAPALGHDMQPYTKEGATCVAEGLKQYKCTRCGLLGNEEKVDKDPDNHVGPIKYKDTKEATCTETGIRVFYCEACGATTDTVVLPMKPHEDIILEAKPATCFETGNKAYVRCQNCGRYDKDPITGEELKGQIIPAYKHGLNADGEYAYIQNVELLNGDHVVKTYDIKVSVKDPEFQAKDFALGIRAINIDKGEEYYTYTIEYVEPTCAKTGYVLGQYCTKCAEIYGNTFLEFDKDDASMNFTGYIIPKTEEHTEQHIISAELPAWNAICGGEVYYSFDIYYCTVCGYYNKDMDGYYSDDRTEKVFDMVTARNHKTTYIEIEIEGSEEKAIEELKVQVVLVDGKFVEWNKVDYPDCTYDIYTAKKCRLCGEFYDVELDTAAFGHYYIDDGQGNKLILIPCDKYDATYVGIACSACKQVKVPEYKLEALDGEYAGLYREVYMVSIEGSEMVPTYDVSLVAQLGYIVIDHEWIETLPCEKTIIKECARCGVKVLNELEKEDGHHNYILRKGGVADFDLDRYDDYAFDDVKYPTLEKEGTGKLTCVVCGEVLDVTIPALKAEITASYDDAEMIRGEKADYAVKNVTVGDKVTVTVKVTANKLEFSELTFEVDNDENRVELESVEVLYDFGVINGVVATIDEKTGDFTLRCYSRFGNAVVENAKNADFVRLTFKTGDLTDAAEVTTFEDKVPGITSIYAKVIKDGEVENVKLGSEGANTFGTLNVYNPNYTSMIDVLAEVYSTGYAEQYDFNNDGSVDLVDYFAMLDFYNSKKTIAEFCELVGYDVEAMLDSLKWDLYKSGASISLNPNQLVFTSGTEADIAYGKEVVKRELAKAIYGTEIIDAKVTIAEFAQAIIDANTL